MKVAILKSHLGTGGGLEKVAAGILEAFSKLPVQVTLVTTAQARVPPLPIQVVQLGYRSTFSLYHHWQFERMVQQWLTLYPHDIVLSLDRNRDQDYYRAGSGVHAAYLARRASLLPKWKQFLLYQNPLHRFLLHQERRAYASSKLKLVITNSKMVQEELQLWYEVPSQKICVIPNGVDLKKTELLFSPERMAGPIRLLFVGNGYDRKGLPFILQALPWLSSYDFELHIIGKGKPIRNVPKNVIFHGFQTSMQEWYQKGDVLLLPSVYDPSANAVVEALAMGLFVVTSASNGAAEILRPSTGIVVQHPENCLSMVHALRQALAMTHNRTAIRNSIQHLDFQTQLDLMARKIWEQSLRNQ